MNTIRTISRFYFLIKIHNLWFWKRDLIALYVLATEETDIEKKKKEEDYDDYPKEKIPYPTQIFYIISMETCERFSYYGMNGKEIQMLILLRFWSWRIY